MYVSCQYKRGINTELFHIITTRRHYQQQPEIRLHSQAIKLTPQVITNASLLFEVVETPTSEMDIFKTGNGESGNGEWGTGNGERGTGNGERERGIFKMGNL